MRIRMGKSDQSRERGNTVLMKFYTICLRNVFHNSAYLDI